MNQSELILQSHDDNLLQKLNRGNKQKLFYIKDIYKLYNNNNNITIIIISTLSKMFWFWRHFLLLEVTTCHIHRSDTEEAWWEEEQGLMGYGAMWPPWAAWSLTVRSAVSPARESLCQQKKESTVSDDITRDINSSSISSSAEHYFIFQIKDEETGFWKNSAGMFQ